MTWVEPSLQESLGAIYRNIEPGDWQKQLYQAAVDCDAFFDVFDPSDWRVHFTDRYELGAMPASVFGYDSVEQALRERMQCATIDHTLDVVPGEFYKAGKRHKLGISLENSWAVMDERQAVLDGMRRMCSKPRLSSFAMGIIIGHVRKYSDVRQVEYEVGPMLPASICLAAMKFRTNAR